MMQNSSTIKITFGVKVLVGFAAFVGAVAVVVLIILLVMSTIDMLGLFSATDRPSDRAAVSTAIATAITGIAAVVGVALAVIGGFYAAGQLRVAQNIALIEQSTSKWDFILRVDERFRSKEQIDIYVLIKNDWNPGVKNEWTKAEGYLRLFERINFLRVEHIVDNNNVNAMWGYRLKQIFDNPHFNKHFDERIKIEMTEKSKLYTNVYHLWEEIEKTS